MRGCRFFLGILVGSPLLVLLGVSLALVSDAGKVSRARFERVEKGMSFSQVVHIVGGEPGDFTSVPCVPLRHGVITWGCEDWLCDEGGLQVCFDDTGRAVDIVVYDVWAWGPPTVLERLRRWFGL
jgi:hypothetical protein